MPRKPYSHFEEDDREYLDDISDFDDEAEDEPLDPAELLMIKEIEKSIGKPLERLSTMASVPYQKAAFVASGGHVIYLYLDRQKFNRIPVGIGAFTNLEVFLVNENDIPEIPDTITRLHHLARFEASRNQISRIPPDLFQSTCLQHLDLKDNKITLLPPEVCNAKNLKVLNLNENELHAVPDCIGELLNLEQLGLGQNHLKFLPKTLSHLKKLGLIWLYNNELTKLPPDIDSLTNMETFWVNNNKLTTLPRMDSWNRLRSLQIAGNPLTSLPLGLNNLKFLTLFGADSGFEGDPVIEELRNRGVDVCLSDEP